MSRLRDDDVAGTLRPGGDDDGLAALVDAASRFVLAHPVAAQQLFHALVTEGRRVGATPLGRRLLTGLADSDLVRRGRMLWDQSALSMLEDAPGVVLPTGLRELLLQRVAGRRPGDVTPRDDRPRLVPVSEDER